MSRPECVLCSAISVVINTQAPASNTNEAAICVTAKARWRRPVLLVMRTLPLARFMPFDALAEGKRGTNAKITAAITASATPTQSMLTSTVKSSARMEKREAYRARMVTSGCAMITPISAPAPQSSRLSANNMRRSDQVFAPSAARMESSPSRRTVRARIRLATFEQAMIKTRPEATRRMRRTVRAPEVISSRSIRASIR